MIFCLNPAKIRYFVGGVLYLKKKKKKKKKNIKDYNFLRIRSFGVVNDWFPGYAIRTRREKTYLRGFLPSHTQTGLCNQRR